MWAETSCTERAEGTGVGKGSRASNHGCGVVHSPLHICSTQLGTGDWQGLRNPEACFPLMDLKTLATRTDRQTETPQPHGLREGLDLYTSIAQHQGTAICPIPRRGQLGSGVPAHVPPICIHTLSQHRIHMCEHAWLVTSIWVVLLSNTPLSQYFRTRLSNWGTGTSGET